MAEKPSDKRRTDLPKLGDDAEDDRESTKLKSASDVPPSRGTQRPFLVVIRGGSAGEMHALRQSEVVIGRARKSTIRVDDDGVSRRHAKVTCLPSGVHIDDLGSANGTIREW
jgi:two-component system, cell cycle response regulator